MGVYGVGECGRGWGWGLLVEVFFNKLLVIQLTHFAQGRTPSFCCSSFFCCSGMVCSLVCARAVLQANRGEANVYQGVGSYRT